MSLNNIVCLLLRRRAPRHITFLVPHLRTREERLSGGDVHGSLLEDERPTGVSGAGAPDKRRRTSSPTTRKAGAQQQRSPCRWCIPVWGHGARALGCRMAVQGSPSLRVPFRRFSWGDIRAPAGSALRSGGKKHAASAPKIHGNELFLEPRPRGDTKIAQVFDAPQRIRLPTLFVLSACKYHKDGSSGCRSEGAAQVRAGVGAGCVPETRGPVRGYQCCCSPRAAAAQVRVEQATTSGTTRCRQWARRPQQPGL